METTTGGSGGIQPDPSLETGQRDIDGALRKERDIDGAPGIQA